MCNDMKGWECGLIVVLASFARRNDIYVLDGLHLTRNGAGIIVDGFERVFDADTRNVDYVNCISFQTLDTRRQIKSTN